MEVATRLRLMMVSLNDNDYIPTQGFIQDFLVGGGKKFVGQCVWACAS